MILTRHASRRAAVFIGLALATAGPAICDDLPYRVEQYYKAWKSADVELIWGLMSPAAKKGADPKVSKEHLKQFLTNTKLEQFTVKDVSGCGADGQCKSRVADATLVLRIGDEIRTVLHETTWILLEGRGNSGWFLDHYSETEIPKR